MVISGLVLLVLLIVGPMNIGLRILAILILLLMVYVYFVELKGLDPMKMFVKNTKPDTEGESMITNPPGPSTTSRETP